ncbi:WD40 domain protein (macronuclear) [Tetrahymena thermophila SB210]|uniref:Cilia- and flagella-associated protein 57 A n=1 Tax=Tetrahymena thermophila (strain SB210) TaxID=312017 RepID=CF57A_TETTS|nr:WD40 domain protein [Tetrahymena thermophila SB210]EAR92035.2 WD40 domain protein [Tetrahymena thermophila SB210]8TID_w Chain w, WD40 domain protein [Tetrahymena thermophila]|eukprot:XP_001012280.2 WD40 domain protein [Tetrahymena thermophila SB210]
MAQQIVQSLQDEGTQSLKLDFSMKYVLGYRSDFKNNIFQYTMNDQNRIIYPAGNTIVISNNENKQQFINCIPGTKGITCMTLSPSKRLLAWSEDCDSGIIVVFDLIKLDKLEKAKNQNYQEPSDKDKLDKQAEKDRRDRFEKEKREKIDKLQKEVKRIITTLDCKSRHYVALDFNKINEKRIVALSCAPDWQLIYFQLDKQKTVIINQVPLKVGDNMRYTHCFFHPKEEDFIVAIGTGAIKPYKLGADGQFKQKDPPFVKKESKDQAHSPNYLSYCILQDGYMVIGTDMGEILLFQPSCEFKTILASSPKNEQFAIQCIQPYSKGFLVGGKECTILFYEKDVDLKNPYKLCSKKIQFRDMKAMITSLLLTPNEEKLIVGVDSGQLLQVPFTSDSMQLNEENSKCEPLFMPFHSDKITGLDVCIRKSLVATCSVDKTVRIWNYSDNQLENSKEFEEEAYAVAFHPSGFHIIVAFTEKIRLMNIFENDLISFKELSVKNCREIQFSNGGHFFAITNVSMVQVFQFYTGENPSNLVFRGSGKVRTIFWEEDDQGFYTGSTDGLVIYWRVDDNGPQKTQIAQFNNLIITSITGLYNPDTTTQGLERILFVSGVSSSQENEGEKCVYKLVISCRQDKEGREITDNTLKKIYYVSQPEQKIFTGTNVSQIAISHSKKLFFFATEDRPGAIRITKYPFTNEIMEIQSHFGPITRMRISFKDNYIFTAGEDGALIIYENKEKEYQVKIENESVEAAAEEFLIPRDQYNDQKREIEKLKRQLNEERMKQEQQIKEKMKDRDDKINQLENQQKDSDNRDLNKYQLLEREKNEMIESYEEKKRMMKLQHENNKRTIENEYKKKIALEMSRNEELAREKEKEEKRFQSEIQQYQEEHLRQMEEKRRHYEEQLAIEKQLYNDLHLKREELAYKFDQKRNKLEMEAEELIDQLKEENESKMQVLFKNLEKAEIKKMDRRNDYDTEAQKLEEQKSKLKGTMEDITSIQETNKMLQKEKESHAKEIDEREKTIRDKGRRIYELKKKTQELEKFKFVLDYKIKELKRDIGPKEEEIAKMKEQIANMNSEILHFKRTNANLKLIVTDLRLRQEGMKKEIEDQSKVIQQNNQYIKAFEQDMSDCHQHIADYKKLKQKVLNLYNQYVQGDDSKKKRLENNDQQKEIMKERAHLETSVNNLKIKHDKNQSVHKSDTTIIMKHNTFLIFEINHLKREKKKILEDKAKMLMQATQKKKQDGTSRVDIDSLEKEIQKNEDEKRKLKEDIEKLRQYNDQIKNQLRQQIQNQQDDDEDN